MIDDRIVVLSNIGVLVLIALGISYYLVPL